MNQEEDEVGYITKNFECPTCGQGFATVWDAFGHLNREHPAGSRKRENVV